MSSRSVTEYDVALVAGVPVERVRQYFSRAWQLSVKQRRSIADAIEGLGYIHADLSEIEQVGRLKRVAIISPYVTVYSFVERIKGVLQALPPDKYDVVTYGVQDSSQLDRFLKSQTRPGATDGVILMSLPISDEIARMYKDADVPLVSIERETPGFPSVTVDNKEGGRLAVQYFLKKGYKKPAFLGDSEIPMYAYSASALRFQGFREALDDAGIKLPESRIAWHPQGTDSVPDAFIGLMRQDDPPDALFCASDVDAVVAIRTSWGINIPVPGQLAVLGFDNLEIAEFVGLSSVDQFLLDSGRDAAEMLKVLMNGQSLKSSDKHYRLKITERIST